MKESTSSSRTFIRLSMSALVVGLMMAVVMLLVEGSRPAEADGWDFLVNSTADGEDANPGDGFCATARNKCTLRAAIQETNAHDNTGTEFDTIGFTIPDDPNVEGAEVKTISPNTALPTISDAVVINGYTQFGSEANSRQAGSRQAGINAVPKIQLSGPPDGSIQYGLFLEGLVNGSEIKGLVINQFDGAGILMSGVDDVLVGGNFIGTDPTGRFAQPNGDGVLISNIGSDITIGGPTPDLRNLISGNRAHGIYDHAGTSFSGNLGVHGNLIGTKKDGTTALGNGANGVFLQFGPGPNLIGATVPAGYNTIAFNGRDGVGISKSQEVSAGTQILGNSIYSNGSTEDDIGIDLRSDFSTEGRTPNDAGDADSGANNLQNFPVIRSAIKNADGTTTVRARLDSEPSRGFIIEFFSSPAGTDEGKTFLVRKTVGTDENGVVNFSQRIRKDVSVGEAITATATHIVDECTSEFSDPKAVTAAP